MLLPRILTALVGIPIVMLCIYIGGLPFFFMFFAVIIFSVMEFYTICKKYNPMNIIGIFIAAVFYISLYLNLYVQEVIILSIFLIFLITMLRNRINNVSCELAITCFGTFFLTWSLYHMVLIRDIANYGMQYIIFLFVNIWVLDTGAYVVGKKFGKHKLAKFISPKKTIEGAIAGIFTGIFTAIICREIFMQNIISIQETIIFAIVISIVGQFSDLAESLFKRDCNIKDSGNILPGHGGMLDRFDSYIFCAPIFYYLIIFIKG
ncbi:MAG: phosphatidate cytidylyltransferase [Endomicrobiaceae bacterium]|nr:phosphatidate cytidylyltransferase [Endomicrobiaceae bacterium]